jgi:hypothetical protein
MKSNPKLDEQIRNASSVEEIRELTLASLAAQGIVTRDKQDQYDVRVNPQAPTPLAPATSVPDDTAMAKDSETFQRVLYLKGNSRFEIFGPSEQDLDKQETGLRTLYGQPR